MFYILFFWLMVLSLLEYFKKISSKLAYWLVLIPITVVTFLRFGIGADYFSYEYIYNNLNSSSIGNMLESFKNIEPGFRLIFYIFKKIGFSYHITISLIATFLNIIVLKWIGDNEIQYAPSMLVYFSLFYFAWTLNAIRQAIVIILAVFLSFNKRMKLNTFQKIVSVLLLSTIHISILMLLPLLFLNEYRWKNRTLLIIFIISLISTLIPIGNIVSLLQSIPYLNKITHYLSTERLGFFDFPGLMRFVLFIFIYYEYIKFQDIDDKLFNSLSQFFLINMIVYFLFKNIEILAARISIFGYFTFVILLPIILNYETKNKDRKCVVFKFLFFISFLTIGLYKEQSAAIVQAGFSGDQYQLNKTTVFNYDRKLYQNLHNHLTQVELYSKNSYDDFFNNKDLTATKDAIDSDSTFIAVKFPNDKYGIIDNEGNIYENGQYTYKPNIYGDWVELKSEGSTYKRTYYKKVGSEETLEQEKIWSVIGEKIKNDKELEAKWFNIKHLEYSAYSDTIIHDFFPQNILKNSALIKFGSPHFYNILEITVYNRNYYLLMDMQLNPIVNRMYNSITPYNNAKISEGKTIHTTEYINEKGDIIWVEKNV